MEKIILYLKILQEYLNEDDAFIAENKLIQELRIENVVLYNLTDGGEGPTGVKRTNKSKKKMSLAHQKPGYTGGKQKLTMDGVKKIKIMLTENKIKMKDIAKLFGVSFYSVSAINRGATWSWVQVPEFVPAKRIPNRKLSEEQVKEIRTMLSANISYAKISKSFNVSIGTIQNIVEGKTFKKVK